MSDVAQDNCKKVKTICRVHKLILYRLDNSLECFDRAAQNYELWQSVQVKYRTMENQLLPLSIFIGRDSEQA